MSRQSRGGNRGHRRGSRRSLVRPPRPCRQGFQGLGIDEFYQILLPAFHGPQKREFYNRLARGVVGLSGILGLVFGTSLLGPLGGFLGLGLGLWFASRTAVRDRYHRQGKS